MAAFATILCSLGLIGLIYGAMQKMKAARISSVPFGKTGEIAANGGKLVGPKGAISAEGEVRCATPLVSPVTGTPPWSLWA